MKKNVLSQGLGSQTDLKSLNLHPLKAEICTVATFRNTYLSPSVV